MKALTVTPQQPGQVTLRTDYPDPEPGPGEVLIAPRLAGICSTDLELARGYMGFAGVIGHEFVGTVMAGPAELEGTRVVGEINCPCGNCALCRRHMGNHCPNRTVLGIQNRDGVFAERFTLPAANCYRVPDEIPDTQAVFVEPLAAALQITRHCVIDPMMKVTVLGSGRLGLLIAQVMQAYHANLTLVGRNPHSLALARELKLPTVHRDEVQPTQDQDVVIEATGNADGLRLAMQLVRPRGTLVLKSTYAEPEPVDLSPLVIHEIRVLGNRCGPFPDALRFLQQRRVEVEPLITARYPLADAVTAFAAADASEQVKVLLQPEAPPAGATGC